MTPESIKPNNMIAIINSNPSDMKSQAGTSGISKPSNRKNQVGTSGIRIIYVTVMMLSGRKSKTH
jgi:hypothetical protein